MTLAASGCGCLKATFSSEPLVWALAHTRALTIATEKRHKVDDKTQTCGCTTAEGAGSGSADRPCLCSAARAIAVAWPGSSGGGLLLCSPALEPPCCKASPTAHRAACESGSWWAGLLTGQSAGCCSRQDWLAGHKHLPGGPGLFLLQPGQSFLCCVHRIA